MNNRVVAIVVTQEANKDTWLTVYRETPEGEHHSAKIYTPIRYKSIEDKINRMIEIGTVKVNYVSSSEFHQHLTWFRLEPVKPKKAQTNVHFSEGHYREAMRYVFHFFDNNVDGVLEDVEGADFCWHLLGGMVCDSPYWTKQQHVESLLELKRDSWGGSAIWKEFFDNPLEY